MQSDVSAVSIIWMIQSTMPDRSGPVPYPCMEDLRPPVRCPHCNGEPNWQEVRQPYLDVDAPGRLGVHALIGWRCNIYPYFLPVSQWES